MKTVKFPSAMESFSIKSILISSFCLCCPAVQAADPPDGRIWAGESGFNWTIDTLQDGAKSSGMELTNITFPITVNPSTVHAYGFYVAQRFKFAGPAGVVGFIGLGPTPDAGGKSQLTGRIEIFGSNIAPAEKQCFSMTDGATGVICYVGFDASYDNTYLLTVKNTDGTRWSGDLTDAKNQKNIHIGSWTLPANTGNILNGNQGFTEYYLGNPKRTVSDCAQLPELDIIVEPAQTSDHGGGIGAISDAAELRGSKTCGAPAGGYSVSYVNVYSELNKNQYSNGAHIIRGFATNGPSEFAPAKKPRIDLDPVTGESIDSSTGKPVEFDLLHASFMGTASGTNDSSEFAATKKPRIIVDPVTGESIDSATGKPVKFDLSNTSFTGSASVTNEPSEFAPTKKPRIIADPVTGESVDSATGKPAKFDLPRP